MSTTLCLKRLPLFWGLFSAWMYADCGGQDATPDTPEGVLTAAARLDQNDIDGFMKTVNFGGSSFGVASGMAVFTPSSELSQLFYGDPSGSAHALSFAVPTLNSGGASILLTNLKAELANSGVSLLGSTATVRLGFDGILHASLPVPIIGTVNTDIQVNPSSVAVVLSYDTLRERLLPSSVSSHLDVHAQNCGSSGWCNGVVDTFLKSKLGSMVEAPLRDAIGKSLDSADVTTRLENLLTAGYNLKDHQASPWTMVKKTLNLDSGAFNFTAERPGP